ncbi:MAG: SDR family NAD(P)-dependent oxidoreductase [Hydrogenophaga sp.]
MRCRGPRRPSWFEGTPIRLQDHVVLITGGASGIGLATVERCLREGTRVDLADLAGSAGMAEAARLDALYPGRCVFVPVDVTSTEQVDAMVETTVSTFGRLDGVFNNAGIGGICPADSSPDADFLRIIDINLNGVFRVARAALGPMYAQGRAASSTAPPSWGCSVRAARPPTRRARAGW